MSIPPALPYWKINKQVHNLTTSVVQVLEIKYHYICVCEEALLRDSLAVTKQ